MVNIGACLLIWSVFLLFGRNISVSVLLSKGCGAYAKTAAGVVRPAGLSAQIEVY